MSDLETDIRASYDRLSPGNMVYLLRNESNSYDELPRPGAVQTVYKATVSGITRGDYESGVEIVDWPSLNRGPNLGNTVVGYCISPRELFLPREVMDTLKTHANLARPRPSRLDVLLNSKGGNFRRILASAMAEVVLERFQNDPRIDDRLVQKR